MDLVFKEGMLYLQGVKFGKITWGKVWTVLFKSSSTGLGRLEFYTVLDSNVRAGQKKLSRQKTPARKVVRLRDCLSVSAAPKESCPEGCTAFYIQTDQCIYTLASTTSRDWLDAVCLLAFQKDPEGEDKGGLERGTALTLENNEIYSAWNTDPTVPPNQYHVTVETTEASRRCQLSGQYLVSPEKEAVILLTRSTGQVLYCWPYRLLRKFGQVEGGFSIVAGRRCLSGKGLFVFLTAHASEIHQTILEHCSAERSTSVRPLCHSRRSLCHRSPNVHPITSDPPAAPPVHGAADVSADHYSAINRSLRANSEPPSFVTPHGSTGGEAESEGDDERCRSLEALSLDADVDDGIYYNLRRSTHPPTRKDDTDCVYAQVKKTRSPPDPQLQTVSSPLRPPVSQPHPICSSLHPEPRYQQQLGVNHLIQPGLAAQDHIKEMEEAISSSTHVTPTEPRGTFKHRLAEIISKDLAKLQPPLPSSVGSPAFSQ